MANRIGKLKMFQQEIIYLLDINGPHHAKRSLKALVAVIHQAWFRKNEATQGYITRKL